MSPALKITLALTGTIVSGLIVYKVMQKRMPEQATTADKVATATVVEDSPKAHPPEPEIPNAIIYTDDPDALAEVEAEDNVWCLPAAEQLVVRDEGSPTISEDDLLDAANRVFVDTVDTRVLPLLVGKTICCYGLQYKCTSNDYVFVDGVHMRIHFSDHVQDRRETERLHMQLSRRIDRIRTETRMVKSRNEKTVMKNMVIKTRVAPGFQILIEFTPKDPFLMPGLQAMFLMVDGEGLIIPRSYTNRPRTEWNADMRVIFTHFLHAVGDVSQFSPALKEQMFRHLCGHFSLLGTKLFSNTLVKQDA